MGTKSDNGDCLEAAQENINFLRRINPEKAKEWQAKLDKEKEKPTDIF